MTNTWGEVWNFILGLDPRTGSSYCFFSAWLQKLSRMVQTAAVFPKSNFSSPFPRGCLILYISFSLILALHLLIMQVATRMLVPSAASSNFLWVAATKVVLFKGHFLINVARSLVVGIYCGDDSFSWNCSSTMLPWLAHCVSPFCLGCPGRLSLKACRSSFLWFPLAEDRIVLSDVSWQVGLFLFIIGRFFLLDMDLRPCMKWVGAAEFFDPTTPNYVPFFLLFFLLYLFIHSMTIALYL